MKPAFLNMQKMPLLYRCILFLAYCYCKFFLRLRVQIKGKIPKGPALIAANHTSYLDPPLVAVSFPEEIHFLARVGLFKNPVFGWFIRNLNAHPIHGDGKDMAVFRTVSEILSNNQKVLIFPEGKRSFDGELEPLKQGVALMSLKNQCCPIIPCWIDGALKAWPRKRKLPHLFGKITVYFGEAVNVQEKDDVRENLKQIMSELEEKMKALRPR